MELTPEQQVQALQSAIKKLIEVDSELRQLEGQILTAKADRAIADKNLVKLIGYHVDDFQLVASVDGQTILVEMRGEPSETGCDIKATRIDTVESFVSENEKVAEVFKN